MKRLLSTERQIEDGENEEENETCSFPCSQIHMCNKQTDLTTSIHHTISAMI